MTRLSLSTLERGGAARRPAFDVATLAVGVVHIGVGAFHRAHQVAFTDAAIEAAGGDWGIVGLSLRRPDAALALGPQDGLFTLETRRQPLDYRILGSLRRVLTAAESPEVALAAIADPAVRVLTLTITEPAYRLRPDGTLDLDQPDVRHDFGGSTPPRTAVGWVVAGLARRKSAGSGPITVISCDNLKANGRKLGDAVRLLATRRDPELAAWIAGEARFPATMVDAITPESDPPLRARVEARLGLRDLACVQREPFAQWAIEDDFAAGRPAWDRVGVELVASLKGHEALKLHVLNAAHSTLACLGPPRDFELVRQAIADPTLRRYLDAMIGEEVAPFLADQDVAGYWRGVSERLANPLIDHRLDQIARDMPVKLRERLHPVIIGNLRAGRPARRLCGVIAAWVAQQGRDLASALADPALFSDAFRRDGALRDGVLAAAA